ncbi:MAG: ribose-5-phosphate isomerase RpiA [Pseudomonadota bacterium]
MDQNALKALVGKTAADRLEDGMVLGIGSGSTAEAFVDALSARVKAGLRVRGVPTSQRTAALCRERGVELTDLETNPVLDLVIDGADELDDDLRLIKGGGGALLREKIVANAGRAMLVIADKSKHVQTLGAYPLPVEINPFGASSTIASIEAICERHGLTANACIRRNLATSRGDRAPFVTDGGHWILDCGLEAITNPDSLHMDLCLVPGVVETGLFIGMAQEALLADDTGVISLKSSQVRHESR